MVLIAALLSVAAAGCVTAPAPVTVELVNNTGLNVVPNLFASASATDGGALFSDNANLYTAFVDRPVKELRPGESVSLQFDCSTLASVGSHFPRSFDPVTLTVNGSSDQPFAINGVDFGCGNTVTIRYFNEGAAFRVRIEVAE